MRHVVAVYGTLKQSQGNHGVMQRAGGTYLGTTRTRENFSMYDGGFPVVLEGGDTPVTVELYVVEDLRPLDSLEGHPTFYKRELVEVEELEESVWMYLYQHEPTHRELIPSGIWRE
jgi:gamma-glutamylcyclotransferase (GGCT)/AIG2-like uncharacterized protein YtfP